MGLLNDTFFNCSNTLLRLDIQRTLWIFTVSLTRIAASFSCLCDDLVFNLICCRPSRSLLPIHLLMTLNKGMQGPIFFGTPTYAYALSLSLLGMGYMEGCFISIFDERSSLGSVMVLLLTAEGSGDFLSDKIDGELGMGCKGMDLDDSGFLLIGLESFFVSSNFCYVFAGLLLQFLKTVDSPKALVLQFLLSLEAPPSLLLQTATTSVRFSWTYVEASSLTLLWNTICLLFPEGLECISDVLSYLIALMMEGRVFLVLLLLGFDVGSLDLLDQFLCRGGGGLMGVYRGSSPLGRVKIGLKPSRLAVALGQEMLERMEGVVSMFLSAGGEQGRGRALLFLCIDRAVSCFGLQSALLAQLMLGRILFLFFVSILADCSFYGYFQVSDVSDFSLFSINFNSLVLDCLLANFCTDPLLLLSDRDSFLLGFMLDCEELYLFLLRVFLNFDEEDALLYP